MRSVDLLFVGLALMAVSSCCKVQRPAPEDPLPQTPVIRSSDSQKFIFSATSDYHDWMVGEQVGIFLHAHGDEGSSTDYMEYVVTQCDKEDGKSRAYLDAVLDSLVARDGMVHDFYSIYPADSVTGGNSTFSRFSAKVTVDLPSYQFSDPAANMQYAYMTAVSKGRTAQSRGAVVLDYTPMETIISVTVHNKCASHEPIDVRKIGLKHMHKFNNGASDNEKRSCYLSGTYDLQAYDGEPFSYNSINFRNGSTYVGATFEPNSVAYGDSLSCTLFILPQSFNANDLRLNVRTTKSAASVNLGDCGISTLEPGHQYKLDIAIDEEDILVSDAGVTANSTQLVAKMLLEKQISAETLQSLLDDVTGVYPGSGTCEIENGMIRVLVDNDNGTRVWRELTEDEIRYLAATVKCIELYESLFQPNTKITPEDLAIFCNLERISFLELNNITELDLSGLQKLTDIHFHHGGQIRIEDCPNLCNVTLADLQGASLVRFRNCPGMTSYSLTGNGSEQAQHTNFEFIDMALLQSIEFDRVGSITVENCPELLSLKINTPSNTTQFVSIRDTPKFCSGTVGRQRDYPCENSLSVTVTNCSNIASGNPTFDIYYRDNHPVITKNNSNRLTVVSHHWDNNSNRDVTDTNLR